MAFPKLVRLIQQFERPCLEDVPRSAVEELEKLGLDRTICPRQTVALTAGSRGIANVAVILKTIVDFLKRIGAKPFLVPAMGSHGGGTAEGQVKILASYGISEQSLEVPLKASMDVVLAGTTPEGYPVFLDKYASEADHIGVVARIKPHTGFHGPIESGLLKMMMIGLGKHEGALACHRVLLERPYDQVVRSVSRVIREQSPITFGLSLVENAYDETALVAGVRPDEFETREENLLVIARRLLGKLPLAEADLLIIDEIGKDISGSGMDTNIVGRKRAFGNALQTNQPRMRFIFVRGLSEHTHGNATGIGLADFTTSRLVKAMDYRATVINSLTAGYPNNANVPVYFDTDREVLDASLKIIGLRSPEQSRVIWIRNTKNMSEVMVSEACLDQLATHVRPGHEGKKVEMTFDSQDNLASGQLT